MKYLKQFFIILLFSLAGELLHFFIPLPIPSSIYGIFLLFTCLQCGWIALSQIEQAGRFLIEIMPVLFVPAAVELLETWGVVAPKAVPYLIMIAISTIFVMVIAGHVTQILLKHSKHKEEESL